MIALKDYLQHGRLKQYRARLKVSAVPRGKLDLRSTARLEARGRFGATAYHQRYLDPDVALNRALALAIFALERYARSPHIPSSLIAQARSYAALFEDVDWRPFIRANASTVARLFDDAAAQSATSHSSRRALEYGRALALSAGLWPSRDLELTLPDSFFLNLEALFESAVRNSTEHITSREVIKGSKLRRSVFIDRPDAFVADPDLVVIGTEGDLVIDVKYKELGPGLPGHSDVYQITAHAHAIGATTAMLVYPLEQGRELLRFEQLGRTVHGIRVYWALIDVTRIADAMSAALSKVSTHSGWR